MRTQDIHTALIARCQATMEPRGLTPIYPGHEVNQATLPGIRFDFSDPVREGGTLKGNEVLRERGSFIGAIMTVLGTGSTDANDHADAFAGIYPEGLRFTFATGKILIDKPPRIMPGYKGDIAWMTPVYIHYEAERL